MANQLQSQSQGNQLTTITKETWLNAWLALPVKSDNLPAEVLRLSTPEICTFNRGSGNTEVGEMVFETAMTTIFDFYGSPYSVLGIRELSQMMHSKYYWLHLAELKHFSLLAKSGDFNKKEDRVRRDVNGQYLGKEEYDGKIYGNITPALLMRWMEEYAQQSLYERANMKIEQSAAIDEPLREGDIGPERASNLLKEWIAQFAATNPDSGMTSEEKEDLYRKEKIAQRQRDVMRRQEPIQLQNNPEDDTPF